MATMAVMVASERVTAEQGMMMFVRLYTVGVRRCRLDDVTTTTIVIAFWRRRYQTGDDSGLRIWSTVEILPHFQKTKHKKQTRPRWAMADVYIILNSGFEHAHAHTNTHTHTDHTKKNARSLVYGNMHRTHTADKPAVSNNSGDPVLNVYCCSMVLPT